MLFDQRRLGDFSMLLNLGELGRVADGRADRRPGYREHGLRQVHHRVGHEHWPFILEARKKGAKVVVIARAPPSRRIGTSQSSPGLTGRSCSLRSAANFSVLLRRRMKRVP